MTNTLEVLWGQPNPAERAQIWAEVAQAAIELRDAAIIDMRDDGETLRAIGDKARLSHTQVANILAAYEARQEARTQPKPVPDIECSACGRPGYSTSGAERCLTCDNFMVRMPAG